MMVVSFMDDLQDPISPPFSSDRRDIRGIALSPKITTPKSKDEEKNGGPRFLPTAPRKISLCMIVVLGEPVNAT
jgi:hypothetical protein